ncbi:probable RNA-directed DNA polymerase from transposon X-element [Trichonephila clavipes]|nr:probable RNA-directed DNA polymerase from transposon X-element [Trichonephila clavipes]
MKSATHDRAEQSQGKPGSSREIRATRRVLNNIQNRIHRKVKAFQNKIWEDELRALDPDDGSLWEMSKELRKKKSPVYALNGQGGIAHTDSDKAEILHRQSQRHSLLDKTNKGGGAAGCTPLPHLIQHLHQRHPKNTTNDSLLYADDTAILTQSTNKNCITHFLHKHLAELENWYKKWKISINPEKTEAVFFSLGTSTRKPPPIHVQNHPVPWSRSVNYLGVTLDEHLSFKDHIIKINNKFRALACLYYPYFTRNSPLSIKNRLLIYTSILRPVLLYASPVWGHATKSNIDRLEFSQNIMIRKLTNSPWFVRNEDLRFALKLTTVRETIKKIATKFFTNLELIDNRTLRKIEIYTPDPNFNRPRNILL